MFTTIFAIGQNPNIVQTIPALIVNPINRQRRFRLPFALYIFRRIAKRLKLPKRQTKFLPAPFGVRLQIIISRLQWMQ
jgi:hypothetical protein